MRPATLDTTLCSIEQYLQEVSLTRTCLKIIPGYLSSCLQIL